MKLQAKGLRIGNWVNTPANWNDGKEYYEECQVTEISEGEVFTCATGVDGVCPTEHYPIELLPLHISSLGFTRMDNYYQLNDITLKITSNKKVLFVFLGGSIVVDYVHELQNLYFVLTREELIYSTKK